MKKWIMVVAMGILSWGAYAQQATTTAPATRIGIVDVRQVLQKIPQVTTAQKKLQEEFAGRSKEIQTVAMQLQQDVAKLNRDGAVMSAKDKDALTKKAQAEQQNLNNLRMSLQRDVYAKQNEAMQKILDQMQGVITKIAQQKGLNLVLAKEAVAYASNELDITNDVVSQMD